MMQKRILSLGAGVQSSALLLLCDSGIMKPVDFAVFADVQAEPEEVYKWLVILKSRVKTPIFITTKGDIAVEVTEHWRGDRKRCGQPPLFTLNPEGEKGMLRRHCTSEYKIEAVDREIRRILGYEPRKKLRHKIEMVMGISYDEMSRMRIPREKWKSFDYPLVDAKLRREDCISIVKAFGLGAPPRSACVFCPFKSNTEWRHLKKSPVDWQKAVEFDRAIRTSVSPNLTSQFFVHRSRVPLENADLSESDIGKHSMEDECEGVCGV